jgi:hypothetical protein
MTFGKRLAVAIGVALLTAFGSLSAAQAQYAPRPYYAPPPPSGFYRSGLTFGGSLGVGAISSNGCGDYCGAAGMIEGHIGGMINPRLALMGDIWGTAHHWDDGYGTGTTYQGIYTLAAQYWVTDILWVKGGVGFAQLNSATTARTTPTRAGQACWARSASRSSIPSTSRSISSSASATASTTRGPTSTTSRS